MYASHSACDIGYFDGGYDYAIQILRGYFYI